MSAGAAASGKTLRGVACDLDGTLLGVDQPHTIPDANVAALKHLDDAGVRIILASGRHLSCMRQYAKRLQEGGIKDSPIISSNGALVTVGEKVVYSNPITPEVFKACVAFCEANCMPMNWYLKDAIYVISNGSDKTEDYAKRYKALTGFEYKAIESA